MKNFIVFFILIGVGTILSLSYKRLSKFGLGKFGLRHLMKWKSSTDTFGNCMLFVSFVFCCVYWLIPYYSIIYSFFVAFTILATMGRVCLLPKRQQILPCWTAFCMYLMGAVGWFCSMMNGAHASITSFCKDVFAGRVNEFFYIMTHVSFMDTLLQGFLMWLPCWVLWNHFKYMRCEKRIRANNIASLSVQTFVICFVMFFLFFKGFDFLKSVYFVV